MDILSFIGRRGISGWTKDDALTLAKEYGIRKAEAIIAEVAEAVKKFRSFAEKHQDQDRWFVIARNKEEHPFIESAGVMNLSEEYLAMLVEKYLMG